MNELNVEDILCKIGFGKVQIQLIFVGALTLLSALNDTLGLSFILPASQCDFQLTIQDKGIISSATFLGVTLSCYFWGFLGDYKGRKFVIFYALLLSSSFAILSAFVQNFTIFVICRFLVGVL
jgi:MFS transporter, VNT family, synaptic vesicle glycoprotein 2